MCKKDHLGCNTWLMDSQPIKTSNVVLYIVFLCISKLPSSRQIKNTLRAIQPQNFGKIKNSQLQPQFYWFLLIQFNEKSVYIAGCPIRLEMLEKLDNEPFSEFGCKSWTLIFGPNDN